MIKIGTGATLFIGGARSGKSDLVVRLASAWDGPVTIAATATPGDEDMELRIARHQADRPSEWGLVESAELSGDELAGIDATALVVIDCLTMLVSNLLFLDQDDDAIVDHVEALMIAAGNRSAPTLIVTNEVGLGVHPGTTLGRRYRDLLGRANRRASDLADASLFVVAGRALELKEMDVSW